MKKELMLKQFSELKESGGITSIKKIKLVLDVDGTEEVIINSDIEKKIEYINSVYDENLRLKNNDKIVIKDWDFIQNDIKEESNSLSVIIRDAFKTNKPFTNNDLIRDGIIIRLHIPKEDELINLPVMLICYNDGHREAWSPRALDFLRNDWVLCEISENKENREDDKDE